MISVEPNLQSQLGEAISLIADSDFWQRWDTLVDVSLPYALSNALWLLISLQELVSHLTPDNAKVNNGVLEVAHSIFKRWRPLFRSDDLFTEINHVLGKFSEPLLQLLEVRTRNLLVNLLTRFVRVPTGKSKQTRIIKMP
jgi:exportin-2 (importin alpha re-exporter)